MIFTPWIVSIIIWVILLQKINFFNLLHSCNTMHGIMRSTINFTTHILNWLNLSYLLSTFIHCLESFFNFCSNLIFHLCTLSNKFKSVIPSSLLTLLSYNSKCSFITMASIIFLIPVVVVK